MKVKKLVSKKAFLRLFLIQIFVIECLKIFGVSYISDKMALGAMGFVAALITVYTAGKKK